MSQFSYLLPRVIIFLLICVAVWIGRDPLIRRYIIRQAENTTGAKVEIAQLRSSFSNGNLFLKDLKIADPIEPMRNLVQAEVALLEVDTAQLLRRNFVVVHGQTNQLMFGVPRTTSGALIAPATAAIPLPTQKTIATEPRDFLSETEEIGRAWLDQIPPGQSDSDTGDFEIVTLSSEIRRRWENQIADHRASIEKITPVISQFKNSLKKEFPNPLRDPEGFARASAELKRLESQAALIRNSLNELQIRVSQEKEALITAKTRDEQKLRQVTRSNQFDSRSISHLLLHESQGKLVEEVVQWFRWFRESIPDPRNDLAPKASRGTDIVFPGVTPQPNFLIQELELEGEGKFANQHLNFAGTAFNLSTQPHLLIEPASFELRAQGNQHMIVKCQIDRRSEQPVDTLHIQCPDFEIDSQSLGNANSLLVSMGPASRIQAEIEIKIAGEELTGTMIFRHSNVSLHVDTLNDLAGGADTALRINQELMKFNRFQTKVTLAGPLDQYRFQFESDLGAMFTSTADQVVINEFEQRTQQQRSRLEQFLAAEVKNLEQSVSIELDELAQELDQDTMLIAELMESIDDPKNRHLPEIRR